MFALNLWASWLSWCIDAFKFNSVTSLRKLAKCTDVKFPLLPLRNFTILGLTYVFNIFFSLMQLPLLNLETFINFPMHSPGFQTEYSERGSQEWLHYMLPRTKYFDSLYIITCIQMGKLFSQYLFWLTPYLRMHSSWVNPVFNRQLHGIDFTRLPHLYFASKKAGGSLSAHISKTWMVFTTLCSGFP